MKDAHKNFIDDIKALEAAGKETLRGDINGVVEKCFNVSGGNVDAFLMVMAKLKPVAQAHLKKNTLANINKSKPLSSKFAKEKINAVQSNPGT